LSVLNFQKMLKSGLRMKSFSIRWLAWLLIPLTALAADAPRGFDTNGVDFYFPRQYTAERVSLDDLATYTKSLQDVCTLYFANTSAPEDLDIDIAVKPGPKSRVWFVSLASPPADQRFVALRQKLEEVEPPPVRNGPIALSIHGVIAGGNDLPPTKPGQPPQMPQDWKTVMLRSRGTRPLTFDEMIDLVWNGAPPPVTTSHYGDYLGIAALVVIAIIWARRYRERNS
jgi:hypothetical protein